MPKISVIVPVYNVEKFLRRCLDSILAQTFQEFELICVNDCSPDDSQKILDEYKTRFPSQIKIVINEKNQGLGKTRENGLAIAEGEYVMFIDSDDYIKPDYLETYYNHIKNTDLDIVVGGYTKDIEGKFIEHYVEKSIWSIVTYSISCAKMYRKDFLVDNDIHFSRVRCGEDIYFSMAVFYNQPKFEVIDYVGYYYYYNEKSITGSLTYDKEHEKFVSSIFKEFLENYDLSKKEKSFYEVIEYCYVANMVNALVTYGHGCKPTKMKTKYEYFMEDMKAKFPAYKKNSLYGIFKPKGQSLKIRLGVGVTMLLHKVGLDKLMFYMISLI